MQVLPGFVVAPLFFQGKIELGVVSLRSCLFRRRGVPRNPPAFCSKARLAVVVVDCCVPAYYWYRLRMSQICAAWDHYH